MKNLKLFAFVLISVVTVSSCSRLQDSDDLTAADASVQVSEVPTMLDGNDIIPCGEAESVFLVRRETGEIMGNGFVLNDEENFIIEGHFPAEWKVITIAAFAGSIHDIPAHDGRADAESFPLVEKFDNPSMDFLYRIPRANLEECNTIALVVTVQFFPGDDGQSEPMTAEIVIDGIDVHDISAVTYCAQAC